jgi:hypothetical protein
MNLILAAGKSDELIKENRAPTICDHLNKG